MTHYRPIVLSFSGHDPSGGAGIQADIETLISHQCHACSVITVFTEQDSKNVKKLIPQPAQAVIDQATTLLNDFTIQAIKIGLVGHHETALAIHTILAQHPHIPVILDPILIAGGGTALANEALIQCIVEKLLPCATVVTPNSTEARMLTRQNDLNKCGQHLLDKGCDTVLITGTDEPSSLVKNTVFQKNGNQESFNWERLGQNYHGSGCTLASAIAALIAQGLEPFTAILKAQEYTWNALQAAYLPGMGQHNPNRLFWMEDAP